MLNYESVTLLVLRIVTKLNVLTVFGEKKHVSLGCNFNTNVLLKK